MQQHQERQGSVEGGTPPPPPPPPLQQQQQQKPQQQQQQQIPYQQQQQQIQQCNGEQIYQVLHPPPVSNQPNLLVQQHQQIQNQQLQQQQYGAIQTTSNATDVIPSIDTTNLIKLNQPQQLVLLQQQQQQPRKPQDEIVFTQVLVSPGQLPHQQQQNLARKPGRATPSLGNNPVDHWV